MVRRPQQQEGNAKMTWMNIFRSHAFISSTIVREVAIHGGDVTNFVPEVVAYALKGKNHI